MQLFLTRLSTEAVQAAEGGNGKWPRMPLHALYCRDASAGVVLQRCPRRRGPAGMPRRCCCPAKQPPQWMPCRDALAETSLARMPCQSFMVGCSLLAAGRGQCHAFRRKTSPYALEAAWQRMRCVGYPFPSGLSVPRERTHIPMGYASAVEPVAQLCKFLSSMGQ
jgi:hypothetical protein